MDKKIIYIILVLLTFCSSGLYLKGQQALRPSDSSSSFTMVAFANPHFDFFLNSPDNSLLALEFFIRNESASSKRYRIKYFIDETQIYQTEISLNPWKQKTLNASPIVAAALQKNNPSAKKEMTLKIFIDSGNRHWQLTKTLKK
jgi:hypothetical protein